MNNKISALVVAKNEEKQIAACLDSLNFVDEIILVLDKSTDNTKKIALKYTKKIFCGSWELEGERRNFGIKQTNFNWIIEIDADERVTEPLKKEIKESIKKKNFDYFIIPVENLIGEKIIKYGWGAYFGKSAYVGLFRKDKKSWGNQRVHPNLYLKGNKGPKLKNSIKHFYCKDMSDFLRKLDSYSSANALDLLENKNKENLLKNLRRLFSRFWKSYILRKGYKEKKIGFIIALMASLYPLISYLKYRSMLRK